MNYLFKAFFSLLLLICTGAHAFGEVREVPANRTSAVASNIFYDRRSCNISPPGKVRILTEPKHGKIDVRQQKITLTEKCAGNKALVNVLYYTPDRGYRGSDSFRYRLILPPKISRLVRGGQSQTVKINVK